MKGKLVAYNATIQGGLFSDSNYRQLNYFQYEIDTGIQLSYASLKMNLGMKYISPELKKGSSHRWGYVSFMFAF